MYPVASLNAQLLKKKVWFDFGERKGATATGTME